MLVRHKKQELPASEQGTFDFVASFGAAAMYLTKPCMEVAVRDMVRQAKSGGQILLTHLLPPGYGSRASIFDVMPMRWWYANARSLGVRRVKVRTLFSIGAPRESHDQRYVVVMTKI
jgi:hypothetical protein